MYPLSPGIPLDLTAQSTKILNDHYPLQVLVGEEPKEMLDCKKSEKTTADPNLPWMMQDGKNFSTGIPSGTEMPWKFDEVRGTVSLTWPDGFKSDTSSLGGWICSCGLWKLEIFFCDEESFWS